MERNTEDESGDHGADKDDCGEEVNTEEVEEDEDHSRLMIARAHAGTGLAALLSRTSSLTYNRFANRSTLRRCSPWCSPEHP